MKVVMITGCSSGIGRSLTEAFQRKGYKVYATARNPASIEDLKTRQIVVERLDVTDEQNVVEVVQKIHRREKQIDILVNNAGYGLMGPLVETSTEELQRQFETNVFAPMTLINTVVPIMIEKQSGIIVNIGSVSGISTTPFSGAYCASKAALHTLTDALRMELAPFNIQVVSVQPGSIKSGFGRTANEHLSQILKPDSYYNRLQENIRERASMSQQDPMPAEVFAGILVGFLKQTGSPRPVIRIGKKSFLLPVLKKWLPVKTLDHMLARRFGLDGLRHSLSRG